MGKDQEFLDAARTGNITVVEKVLSQKAKRVGPLASLRRGPGVNVQDSGGYSALHHACINGHSDIVRLLLAHEASPNLPDSRGSSPLHLAAWAGYEEIVKMLLSHPYRPANPNLLTIENETPLHCAAQHGHTGALAMLLSHNANPNMRNSRGETPLDLAAQYGRLQAVQMLIRGHPELLAPYNNSAIENSASQCSQIDRDSSPLPHYGSLSTSSPSSPSLILTPGSSSPNIFPHTCLHLASRNGHKSVVEVLLTAGVSVNLLTPSGTALHEAALCGKESVVRTLLKANIDLNATDAEGRTALDILKEFPPHVTKHIIKVIKDFRNQMDTDDNEEVVYRHHYINQFQSNANSRNHFQNQQHYHFNSNNHLLNHSHSMQQAATHGKHRYSGALNSAGGKSLDSCLQPDDCGAGSCSEICISPSSSISSFEPASVSPRSRSSTGGIGGYGKTPVPFLSSFAPGAPPKKPPRRNLSVSPTHAGNQFIYTSPDHSQRNYVKQKQQRSPSNESPYGYHHSQGSVGGMSFDETQLCDNQRIDGIYARALESTRSTSGIPMSTSYDMLEKRHCTNKAYDENVAPNQMNRPLLSLRNVTAISKDIINCENPILKSYNPNRKLKRNRNSYSLTIDKKEQNSISSDLNSDTKTQTPLSPTNYQQPPTPEHPPPSSSQAERTIHERIRPLSQEYKRRSALLLQQRYLMKDCSTSPPRLFSVTTFQQTLPPPPPQYDNSYKTITVEMENNTEVSEKLNESSGIRGSSGSLSSSISCSDQSVSTDFVEEYICEIPFAGLYKGSTVNVVGESISQKSSSSNHLLMKCQHQTRPPLPTKPTIPELSKISQIVEQKNLQLSKYSQANSKSSNGIEDKILEVKSQNNVQSNDDVSHLSNISAVKKSNDDDAITSAASEKGSILSPFNAEEARKKISEIIESFGSGILNTNITPTHDIELDFDDMDISAERHELALRLRSAGVLHLERMLFENGYDNYKFVNGVFEETDLLLMHIPERDSSRLLSFVSTLPRAEFQKQIPLKAPQDKKSKNATSEEAKGISTLYQWLQSISLPEYIEIFNKHLYNTIDSVCGVWDVELQTVLEINKLGHRRRILQSLSYIRLARSEINPIKTPLTENTETNKISTNGSKFHDKEKWQQQQSLQQQQHQLHLSSITGYRKNRPAPQPPATTKPDLQIRAPSELLLGLPVDLRTKWRHSANALLNEQIRYEVYYLGSTVVKKLCGTESTRKSIEKLKNRISNMGTSSSINSKRQKHKQYQKRTLVGLAISYRGVEFVNTENRQTICEHEIQNINCACQDSDDLNHFAYTTKENHQHYCHVFFVDNTDLATEIILTLGQAFEVAYQLALRDRISDSISKNYNEFLPIEPK